MITINISQCNFPCQVSQNNLHKCFVLKYLNHCRSHNQIANRLSINICHNGEKVFFLNLINHIQSWNITFEIYYNGAKNAQSRIRADTLDFDA